MIDDITFCSDDITFCSSECIKAECFRHRSNIQQPQYPHSFADFKGTPDCPYWEKGRVEKEQ